MRMLPRTVLATLVALLVGVPAPAQDAAPAPDDDVVVVRSWLVLPTVDRRGRHPFNPETVLARHLLDRDAPLPREGDVHRGSGREATWKAAAGKADGTIEVEERIAWACAELESANGGTYLAELKSGGRLWVNGAAFAGAVYGDGGGVFPVRLEKGTNRLFVQGSRGAFRLTFRPARPGIVVHPADATLPDAVTGRAGEGPASFRILNTGGSWTRTDARYIRSRPSEADDAGDGAPHATWRPTGEHGWPLAPLAVERATGLLHWPAPGEGAEAMPLRVQWFLSTVRGEWLGEPVDRPLLVRSPDASYLITFVSDMDGSVQVYAVRDPAPSATAAEDVRTVLTVHGAGVGARGQAGAYSSRPGVRIVAATNRRPFGFDWQDWGRRDAYEVLAHALANLGGDPSLTCLTGHSMGGHGTWHLAANDPDAWAAIAPSAGWRSFDTYAGGRPDGPLRPLWHAADAASDTEALVANLVPIPTFVVHGTADDNVPVSEAEAMLALLREHGGRPGHHFAEGKGHWWNGPAAPGADCVDWPGIFDLFSRSRRPVNPTRIAFTTVDPGVDATHHWATVLQPMVYGEPCRLEAEWSPKTGITVTVAENVRRFELDPPWPASGLVLPDGSDVQEARIGPAAFVREGDDWLATLSIGDREVIEGEKSPARSGPFKRAFDRRFVLVVGTAGDADTDRELLERARYDSALWSYRANGRAPLLRDTDFLERRKELGGRNVILYGNADDNAAWASVVPADAPLAVRKGSVTLGDDSWSGDDLGVVAVLPRADDEFGLVGVVGSTGIAGARAGYGLLPFTSGVGYPDYAIFGTDYLSTSDGGIRAAGWWDHRWRVQEEGRYRRKEDE